jgi:hypothetical protein
VAELPHGKKKKMKGFGSQGLPKKNLEDLPMGVVKPPPRAKTLQFYFIYFFLSLGGSVTSDRPRGWLSHLSSSFFQFFFKLYFF